MVMDEILEIILAFILGTAPSHFATRLLVVWLSISQPFCVVSAETSSTTEQADHTEQLAVLQRAEQRLMKRPEALVRAEASLAREQASYIDKLATWSFEVCPLR